LKHLREDIDFDSLRPEAGYAEIVKLFEGKDGKQPVCFARNREKRPQPIMVAAFSFWWRITGIFYSLQQGRLDIASFHLSSV
jgi:hypothetical protein